LLHALLADARFYDLLTKFDEDLAARVRAKGCVWCGAVLHSASYQRKPRGAPIELGPAYERRFSLCCDRDGCRRRATPASVRFFGRRVYLGITFVLVMAMSQGLGVRRTARLHAELGVGLRTLRRWRKWWLEVFVKSELWRRESARLMPPVQESELPAALIERFARGAPSEQLLALLSFLRPLTTHTA
jgi:hypothetical protein